jgi:ribosomal-protein-serine acetyltransferase
MSICIRRYEPDDAQRLYEAARESIFAMQPWMPWCHPAYSIEDSRQWVASKPDDWDSGRAKDFVISDAEGRFLGACGLNQFNTVHRFANLGYWVRLSARGNRVAAQAVRLLADWAFRETDLDRLEIVAAVGNVASQRVARRAGAIQEGLLRQRLVMNGQRYDAVMFSILRSDWKHRGEQRISGA